MQYFASKYKIKIAVYVSTHRKNNVYVSTHRKERCVTMASVNFEKFKSKAEVKAMFRHCDSEERMKHEHSNKQINKDLTQRNFTMLDYKDSCTRFDERLEYLDSLDGANKRKDRVIAFGLTIPMPADIPISKRKDFLIAVYKCLSKQYGDDNLVAMYLHVDEKHTYSDAETQEKRQSLDHIHAYFVPEINGKLNGKVFSSRNNMMKLNKAIHEMCQSDFGVDFMDGSKRKSKKSVETLKNQSEQLEFDNKLAELNKTVEQYRQLKTELYKQKNIIDERERVLNERERALNEQEERFELKRMRHAESVKMQNKVYSERIDEIQSKNQEVNKKNQEADNYLALAMQIYQTMSDEQKKRPQVQTALSQLRVKVEKFDRDEKEKMQQRQTDFEK